MKAQRQKLPPFKLDELTCEQLHNILASEPAPKERTSLKRIRKWFKDNPERMRWLLLCRKLNAKHYKSWMITAMKLDLVPEIEMMIGGGHPKKETMPDFTRSLKIIGEMNGIVIHRWDKGAFRLKKKAPSALEE